MEILTRSLDARLCHTCDTSPPVSSWRDALRVYHSPSNVASITTTLEGRLDAGLSAAAMCRWVAREEDHG